MVEVMKSVTVRLAMPDANLPGLLPDIERIFDHST